MNHSSVDMHSEKPSEFEAAVLEWIATATADPALHAQLATVQVSTRDHTGVGCYCQLALPADAPGNWETGVSHLLLTSAINNRKRGHILNYGLFQEQIIGAIHRTLQFGVAFYEISFESSER